MKSTSVWAAAMLFLPLLCAGGADMAEITKEKVLAESPEWQAKYDGYKPEADMLEAARPKLNSGFRAEVYLGLWCPDSRNNVPPFIKIIDGLGANVPVRYFAVQRKASKDVPYYVDALKVERVPTFVFYRGDKEIGRIVENPKVGMIEDFLEVVFKDR